MRTQLRAGSALALFFLLVAGSVSADGAEPKAPAVDPQLQQQRQRQQAVLAAIGRYVESYNKHDAKACGACWTSDGLFVERNSTVRLAGLEAIEKAYAELFKKESASKLSVAVHAVRFITPDVAQVESTSVLRRGEAEVLHSDFLATLVRENDQWLLDNAHESEPAPAATPYTHLKQLEWWVGDWVDATDKAAVNSSVKWMANQAFLSRTYTVSREGQPHHEGMQLIGWDPKFEHLRVWVFDSEGGFGQGTCSVEGSRLVFKLVGTLPDGRSATATQVVTRVDGNTLTMQWVDQEIDGAMAPAGPVVKVVRAGAKSESGK